MSATWWIRWKLWRQAKASRYLQERVHSGPEDNRVKLDQLTQEQMDTLNWAESDE